MSHKILIANRGEIACRVIAAAKTLGLKTVAVYSEADADAPHTRAADEAYLIGPARPAESYLNQQKVIAVAKECGATLVHPGYGFLAENPSFADLCLNNGLIFVGPKPDVIQIMGDKERARLIAVGAGVPVVPGAEALPDDPAALASEAARVGYPLLVKASAGGGGIGMRRVDAPAELAAAVEATRTMAERAFGNGTVYFERYIRKARHIEIQVFGFGDGRAVHLFERDCSVQRRHQKIIEEAVAPGLSEATRAAISAVAVKLACACRYDGAGTVEFLVDAESGEFFFLEMNTRIQVEHPVTEMVTGVDLVAAQIRHAMGEDLGESLSQECIKARGHAIEARVYAERPAKNFIPAPGLIEELVLPQGEGIRVDTGFRGGMKVTPFYDPMLMKIIAHGATRAEAIARLDAALAELVLKGIETNVAFVRRVLAHPTFIAARAHTMFVSESLTELLREGNRKDG